jgi:TRAP-type uncharacterized transport system substrate-binding protein
VSQPFESPRPATIRSQLMLETVSELVAVRGYPYQQAQVQIRPQGAGPWTFTLFGSDGPESIDQVASRAVDVAIINPSAVLTLAYRGKGPYREPIPVRAIGVIPSRDWFGFAVKESTGLKSLGDIKSQRFPLRVSLRAQRDHSVHLVVDQVLQAHGFSLSDIVEWGGEVSYDAGLPVDPERIGRVGSGEIDAIFDEAVTRFIPPAVELGMRFLPIEERAASQLAEMGLRPDALPKSLFPMLPTDVRTVDFSGFAVFTHAETPESFIYDFSRALDARRSRIPTQQGPSLPLDSMCKDTIDGPLGVPLHPGAERYWREVGYLP